MNYFSYSVTVLDKIPHPGSCSAQCNSLSSVATCEHLFAELLKLELIICYVVLK